MKRERKKVTMVIVLLLLVGITSGYVARTYAKYVGTISGKNATATVARWAFTGDNSTQSLTINFAETYDTSTLDSGKIAPGTEGSFSVALVNTNSEVGVDWTIALNSIDNQPTNIKFYRTRTGSAGSYIYSNPLTPGTSTITGQLAAKDSTGVNVPIYWQWPYETSEIATNDPLDSADGEAANTLTIGVDITGVQTPPSTTEITSHVDD